MKPWAIHLPGPSTERPSPPRGGWGAGVPRVLSRVTGLGSTELF